MQLTDPPVLYNTLHLDIGYIDTSTLSDTLKAWLAEHD
jgi:hypothetical protein